VWRVATRVEAGYVSSPTIGATIVRFIGVTVVVVVVAEAIVVGVVVGVDGSIVEVVADTARLLGVRCPAATAATITATSRHSATAAPIATTT